MEAVNHLRRGAGMGNEQGRGESGCGHAEGDGELLHRAGDRAAVTGLRFREVRIGQGVHAGVLHRGENAVGEGLKHDQPDRCADTYGGK